MDPITIALTALASALLEAAMEVAAAEGIEAQVLKRETQNAQKAAIEQTIQSAKNTEIARLIFRSLDESVKQETRRAFAKELKKILLLSDQPNIEMLVIICERHLRYRRGFNPELPEIDQPDIKETLSSLIKNLRLHLLEQPIYKKLYTHTEILKIAGKNLSVSEELLVESRKHTDQFQKLIDLSSRKLEYERIDFYAYINHPPSNYVARQGLIADVVNRVTSPNTAPIVFHGMGGIGKSVIARVICEDVRVQECFSGGILLLELGKNPNIVQILNDLIDHLGGTFSPNSASIPILKNNLAELLAKRKVLLIVDNAWSYSDVEIFNVTNRDSRIFITTRQGLIAEKLGVSPLLCPGMTPSEGLELLTKWSGKQRVTDSEETRQKILEKLGFHPLAIKLAGAQLARRLAQTSEDWLSTFNARMLEMQPIETVSDSLKLTFDLSLELLPDVRRSLYRMLSIFTEDKNIPSNVALGLWQHAATIHEIEAHDALFELTSMALIDNIEDSGFQTIRLHPLLRDFVRDELDDKQLETTHYELVGYYRQSQQEDGWTTVVADGYYYEYLAYHLVGARMSAELYSLLIDSPAWWEAKLAHSGHFSNYVDDIQIALSTFSEPITVENLTILVQLYAARHAVQRITAHYWDGELQAMVWLDRSEEALRLAWLRSNPKARFSATMAIQRTLKEQGKPTMEFSRLIALIRDIQVVQHQVEALIELVEFLDVPDDREISKLIDDALKNARREPTSYQRTHDIISIAKVLITRGNQTRARTIISDVLSNQDTFQKADSSIIVQLLELALSLEFSTEVIADLHDRIITNLSKVHTSQLPFIASKLLKASYTQDAENIVEWIEDIYWKVVTLGNMAVVCHEEHREETADMYFTRAFYELQQMSIGNPFETDAAAYMLVGSLALAKRFYQAANLTYNIRYLHWRNSARSTLIYNLSVNGHIVDARLHYVKEKNALREKHAKVQLCLAAAKSGYTGFASSLLARQPSKDSFDETDHNLTNKISSIIDVLVEQNSLNHAEKMAEMIPNPHRRLGIVVRIALSYLHIDNTSDAKRLCEIADNLTPSYDDVLYVEGLAFLMLAWFGLGDYKKAKKSYERAMGLARNLSRQYGRCTAIALIIKFSYLTRNSDNDLWAEASSHISQEIDCKDEILRELSTVVDFEDDLQLVDNLMRESSITNYYGAQILEKIAERAYVANNYDVLDSVLIKLESYSHLDRDYNSEYIEGFARVLINLGDFEKALNVAATISHVESRAAIQAQIAAAMLLRGEDDKARQIFAEAASLASSVQTFGQWHYALGKWSASLFQRGDHLEALGVYQPDQLSDYTKILDEWKAELGKFGESLAGELFMKIIRIYAWGDPEWSAVLHYLAETS